MTNPTRDVEALKADLKATWMAGNYDYFSRFMESSAVDFLDRLGVEPGSSFLDVACGSGQVGLIAARRGAEVTGVDIATNAIMIARSRALADGSPPVSMRVTRKRCPTLTLASMSSPVSSVRCLRHALTALRTNYCGYAGEAAPLRWGIGRRADSSARRSRPLRASSHQWECRLQCFGETRRSCVGALAVVSQICV